MTHIVEAFACDYCGRILQNKSAATCHENNHCRYSPKAARCDGCANLIVAEPENGKPDCNCKEGIFLIDVLNNCMTWKKHCEKFVQKQFMVIRRRK